MLRHPLRRKRSGKGIIQSLIAVKVWLAELPSVEAVRPGRCPLCGNPGRPVGASLGIQGHGVRERLQSGPRDPGSEPTVIGVACRRYECTACDGVLMVVPCGVVRERRFSAMAIGLALALFGHGKQPEVQVRRQISPWQEPSAAGWSGWLTLRRWITAVRRGVLFARAPTCPAGATGRQVAERVAMALAAQAPPGDRCLALELQAFLGAARMA